MDHESVLKRPGWFRATTPSVCVCKQPIQVGDPIHKAPGILRHQGNYQGLCCAK